MRQLIFRARFLLCAGLASGVCATAAETAGTESAVWQQHQELIDYFGTTERYTCEGIEDQIHDLLLHLGARADLRVTALCGRQLAAMSQVFVRVNFYSLAPASDGSTDTVVGHWLPLDISPSDPQFLDRGECELFQSLKNMLTKDFTIRDVSYSTYCTPNSTTLKDYKITGQLLAPPELARAGLSRSH